MMQQMGRDARAAARVLALATAAQKSAALHAAAAAVRRQEPAILAANAADLAVARQGGMTAAYHRPADADPGADRRHCRQSGDDCRFA
jgi:glutamate-5-semialdehyde dehydrogenase